MRRERSVVRRPAGWLVALVLLAAALVAVGSGSARTGGTLRLRPCSPQGYGLEAALWPLSTANPDAVAIHIGWLSSKEGRRSCSLHTMFRWTIVGSNGSGAHGHWSISTVLQPWSFVVHTWLWRNWCKADQGVGLVTITITSSGGQRIEQPVLNPPSCIHPGAPTTVVDRGTGTKYVPRPGQRIPPHILPNGSPPAIHEALIKVKNAWIASDGYTLVAVYAGAPGVDPKIGRFAILRQNLIFGIQYAPPDFVNVGKVGALKITQAPTGASHERSAQQGALRFSSARGAKGVLELVGDRVRVTSR